MHKAVLAESQARSPDPRRAVADFGRSTWKPKTHPPRSLNIECEATEDIALAAGKYKLPHQRTVGFALESQGNLDRAREKLFAKHLDLIVSTPFDPRQSQYLPNLIYPDGRTEPLASASKADFADTLLQRALALWK